MAQTFFWNQIKHFNWNYENNFILDCTNNIKVSQTYAWNVYTFLENVGNILLILWNISYYIWNIGPSPCWIITILQVWSFSFQIDTSQERWKSSITSTRSWGADIASKCKLWLLTCSQRWTLPFKLRSRIFPEGCKDPLPFKLGMLYWVEHSRMKSVVPIVPS